MTLRFPRHNPPLTPIAFDLFRRSWRLVAPSFIMRFPFEALTRLLSSVTLYGSSECMLVPWPSSDNIACIVFRPSLVVDPIPTSASSKSVWPCWPRSPVVPHQIPVSASSSASTSNSDRIRFNASFNHNRTVDICTKQTRIKRRHRILAWKTHNGGKIHGSPRTAEYTICESVEYQCIMDVFTLSSLSAQVRAICVNRIKGSCPK